MRRDVLAIVRFVVLACVVYGVLMAPWPDVGRFYASSYRAAYGWLFHDFGEHGSVYLEPHPVAGGVYDTRIVFHDRVTGGSGWMDASTRYTGYAQTALLVALLIVSPLRWERRIVSLVWGILLLHVFITLWLAAGIFLTFCVNGPFASYQLNPWQRTAAAWLHTVVQAATSFSFMIPVMLWLAVSYGRAPLLGSIHSLTYTTPRR